jgi:hypothetical protein
MMHPDPHAFFFLEFFLDFFACFEQIQTLHGLQFSTAIVFARPAKSGALVSI